MSLFGNLKTEGLEENQDRIGGFTRLDTNIYGGTIKVAFAGQSDGGAKNVTLILSLANGQEHRETVYITNKKGEVFFVPQNDKAKKVALPGFTVVDDLCQVTTDKVLAEQDTEDKVVNVWNSETKKEEPKSVPVLTELTGKPFLVAIRKVLSNKSGPAPDYAPIADTREENVIEKVFHPELRITVVEAKAGKQEPEFYDAWLKANEGKVSDRRKIKDGDAGTAGRPRSSSAGAPQGGEARKSLFGNKS